MLPVLSVLFALTAATTSVAECAAGQICNADEGDEVKMVQSVIQSFVFVDSTRKPGKRFRRQVMVSKHEDVETKTRQFCEAEGLDEAQCHILIANMQKKRQVAAADKPAVRAPSVHIVVQYYNDRNPLRATEIDACLRFNLANPHVLKVHALLEAGVTVPQDVATHPKLHILNDQPRLTFKAAFSYASDSLPANSSVALINGDIYLDHESPWGTFTGRLQDLTPFGAGKYSLALARAEVDDRGQVWKMRYMQQELSYSFAQDAWVFKTPLTLEDADYTVGNCPGSDNAIAERLHRAGHIPLNFCHVWRIYHLDSARKKFQDPGMVYTNKTDRSHPERRGFRTLPSFGEVRSFADLEAHAWVTDPILEYIYMTDYLAESTEIGHPSDPTKALENSR